MLPDFAKVREPISEAITLALRGLVNQRPLIASIRSEHFFEGHMWGGSGEHVAQDSHGFAEFKTPSSVPTAELIERGPDALLDRLPALANAMADQIEKRMRERIEEAADKTDAVHAGHVRSDMTFDEFLTQLEPLAIDFDQQGEPIMPMILGGPEFLSRMRAWDADPEANAKLTELLHRKREGFDARESNRVLVD